MFNSWDHLKHLINVGTDRRVESIVVKHTAHLHQCDLASLVPLELYLLAWHFPQTTTNETYLLMSQLLISFFHRAGFSNGEVDIKKISEHISSMKE